MMSDLTNLTATAGGATRVADVENELNTLWTQIAEEDSKHPLLRATTLNLVLFTEDANSVTTLIGQLSETHPCRAIVIETGTAQDVQPDSLVAVPTLFCRPSLGAEVRKQVCCEEIVLRVGRDASDRVPGAVQGLLLSDLPAYIFWQGDVSISNVLLKSLGEVTDGWIVDSATFDESTGLTNLVWFLDTPHWHGSVYDLNWQRLLFWRGAVAQSFDSPQDRPALKTIRDVEVAHHDAPIQALLFVGWLASRLDWQLVPGNQPNVWTNNNGLMVRILSVAEGGPGLRSVNITAEPHVYSIDLADEDQFIHTTNGRARAFQLPEENTGTLIGAIIDTAGRDVVFEAALAEAAGLSDPDMTGVLSWKSGLVVAENAVAFAHLAARYFLLASQQAIKQHGLFTVALSGGSTPKALYSLLAQPPYRDQVEWTKVHVFWGDERNVPIDHPDSCQRMAHETLLDKVPIPPANIHGIATGTLSAEDAATRYAEEIRSFFKLQNDDLPVFDLILLGLGEDGHTASLFPHSPALSADDTQLFVANPVEKLNTTRLTLTAGVINNANTVMFLVSGASKAAILHVLLEEPPSPDDFPSQRIHPSHGTLLIVADRDAASKLQSAY